MRNNNDDQITIDIYKSITIKQDRIGLTDKEWKWLRFNKGVLENMLSDRVESDVYEYEYDKRFIQDMKNYFYEGE